ncbi:hypothetical protein [uncultured Acetatifactor sp.]|uniref:hypothetical protein n=1 Tax=uncultured Acetatifactor sp. TaxID=1671927 RepID=UPI00260E8B48|nr:hypothetical protein [uncultured Acetatifactor sp.]
MESMKAICDIVAIAIRLSDASFELAYNDAVKNLGTDFANVLKRIRNKYRKKVGSPV